MDEFYCGYRIAIKQADGWVARITHARGTHIPLSAKATEKEGAARCLARARELVDRYVEFLGRNGIDGEPN